MTEAGLHEFQETLFFGFSYDVEVRSFARQSHAYQCGFYFWRWTECAGREAQRDFGLGVKLAEHGKVAVVAQARMRGDAFGYFQLNDDVDGGDCSGPAEKMVQDRRGDVVRQVSVHVNFAVGEFADVGGENVCGDDFQAGPLLGIGVAGALQAFGKTLVGFDGDDAAVLPTRSWVISPWPGPISIQV